MHFNRCMLFRNYSPLSLSLYAYTDLGASLRPFYLYLFSATITSYALRELGD